MPLTKLTDLQVVLFDCQTTGGSPSTGDLLELAWSYGNTKRYQPIESALVELPDGEELPPRIARLTGITPDMMDDALPPDALINQLQSKPYAGTRWAVAHYARFEKSFLDDFWLEETGQELPWRFICTHAISKRLFPDIPSRSLRGVAGYFGEPPAKHKRAAGHVEATQQIWGHLVEALDAQGITTVEELNDWLSTTKTRARKKLEYQLPKEKRLGLPDEPGVYRMLGRGRKILYVGKATSLKDRVNSYFRGQKKRNTRQLEMLTQVVDIDVTICHSPTESALLETDEIKRHKPPYNVALIDDHREVWYTNRDLTEAQNKRSKKFCFGPFTSLHGLSTLHAIGATASLMDESNIWIPLSSDDEIFQAGLKLYLDEWEEGRPTPRQLLADGIAEVRLDPRDLSGVKDPLDESQVEEELEDVDDEEHEWTAEDVYSFFAGSVRGMARQWLRFRWCERLLDSDVIFKKKRSKTWRHLSFSAGKLKSACEISHPGTVKTAQKTSRRGTLSVADYDRMRVLSTEILRMVTKGYQVVIHTAQDGELNEAAIRYRLARM